MPVKESDRWVFREIPEHLKRPVFLSELQDGLALSARFTAGPHVIGGKVPVPSGFGTAGYAGIWHISTSIRGLAASSLR